MDYAKAVKAYVKMRDTRAANKKAFEEQDEKIKTDMAKIEFVLLKHLQEVGADSIATPHGTFYKQLEILPTGQDWDAFYKWIIKEDVVGEALERRIKKTFIAQYMEANEGKVPPGVNVLREYVVRIRRK